MLKDQVLVAAQNVKDSYHPRKLFELLLNTAQLEYILSQVTCCCEVVGIIKSIQYTVYVQIFEGCNFTNFLFMKL